MPSVNRMATRRNAGRAADWLKVAAIRLRGGSGLGIAACAVAQERARCEPDRRRAAWIE